MKMNNFTYIQQEKSFEEYLGYEEWLRDNLKAPSEDELNHMEQSIKGSSTLNKHIINNLHYQPLQGA